MRGFNFQLNKVKRFIQTYGENFLFSKPFKNEFNEPNGETESLELSGVFHETSSYQTKKTGESSTTVSKSSPKILCLWNNAKDLNIDCTVTKGSKQYQISGISNLAEADLVADISLEEIQAL